ncbi:MAG: helix-turn-helix transcriptional regulator, partial [Lachnospiraceae bacterium]|nr:helix-turn-helix transcriptional regulator [Lachnospiraceae bacterium]
MNNLKTLRELNGLKQAALARELDIRNQASISEWETGRKSLSVENAIMFAHFFGVSVGCVVGTEPIPDGYPGSYTRHIFYSDLVREHQKAAEEGRMYNPPKK